MILRRIGAVLAGALAGIVLSLGTDELLRAAGWFAPLGQSMAGSRFLLATAYRTLYGVAGSYLTARLAPDRPMAHALVFGGLGLIACIAGVAATWDKGPDFGPKWQAVLGGKGPDHYQEQVRAALAWLERKSTARDRDNLARFGIDAKQALGVSVANIQLLARQLGRDHELAAALWQTGCYEARMLCSFVDEPDRVTPAQMDRWCRDFDNWGICDTICFHLFDRTPHAFAKVAQWSGKRGEFVKRAAFALLASLAGHDKKTGDKPFLEGLVLIERAAADERNFVKKGVSWALRGTGRRNQALHDAAMAVALRLSGSPEPAARWIGKDAVRDLTRWKARAL